MDKATTTTPPSTITSTNDQTHDFMNVDSFSQLPFIRPSPSSNKDNKSSSGLRLFGIDFSSSSTATDNSDSGDSTQNNNNNSQETKDKNIINSGENGESGRKFECHYCCRNFPTSQALGGHQNAHKRERQHAKRAHLQSAMMAADPNHHHLYNVVNYTHRPHSSSYYPTSSSLNTSRFSYHPTTTSTHFHTTTTSSPNFGHHNHHAPPTINGNPLVWRIPSAVHSHHHIRGMQLDRSLHPLPYFGGMSSISSTFNINNSASKATVGLDLSSSQSQVGRDGSSDHVSLDLHL